MQILTFGELFYSYQFFLEIENSEKQPNFAYIYNLFLLM